MPQAADQVAIFPFVPFCRIRRSLNFCGAVLHMLQRNILRKGLKMKKIFKQWLHDAALAAEFFTGQAHWYAMASEPTPAPARQPRQAPRETDFGALHAAD